MFHDVYRELLISKVKGSFIFFREKKNVILYSLDLFPLKGHSFIWWKV